MLLAFFQTIFSFRAYHLLAQAGKWRTAFFGLYLLLVGVLVFTLYFIYQVHQQLPRFVQQIPAITFEKGRLVAAEKNYIPLPSTGYTLLLDPSGKEPLPTVQDFTNRHLLAFVQGNQFYMPSVTGLNQQVIPPQVDGRFDSQTLQPYLPALRNLLHSIAFVGSFFVLGSYFLFAYLMAWCICLFWRTINRRPVPFAIISRWALLLQGPALVLFIVHLLVGVPLFLFALFVLFNIYVQQIFNTLPDGRKPYAS